MNDIEDARMRPCKAPRMAQAATHTRTHHFRVYAISGAGSRRQVGVGGLVLPHCADDSPNIAYHHLETAMHLDVVKNVGTSSAQVQESRKTLSLFARHDGKVRPSREANRSDPCE